MLTEQQRAALEAAWTPARTAGVLGTASLETLWEHTAGFASAVCSAFSARCSTWNGRVIDVGTGAGVPGILLAVQFPEAELVLADASERRLDHVRAAVRALDLADRVEVCHARAEDLGRDVGHRGSFDVAVSRLLAAPSETLELLAPLVRVGGVMVSSLADDQRATWERAPQSDLELGPVQFDGAAAGSFVTIPLIGPVPETFPRRGSARRRRPLLA